MSKSITLRRTYKYRLYSGKENKSLTHQINVAGLIWNHCLALRKRYYRRFKKSLSASRLERTHCLPSDENEEVSLLEGARFAGGTERD